ncbi:MAG: hypothetical protein DI530_08825 [Sphingomonas sp.]|uniref:hypothetical protein n=1 Tax=Sphingomonas sp. TaxID=28214 RepID=UPI000DBC1DEB|nr:hypothetical protein [Sphingomonas sp.]PZU79334.1 MAG: hypothetical protein DI530_08825 [Sphingomonas sp.]
MREDEARVQLQAAADAAAMRGSLIFHLQLAATLGLEALAEAGVAVPLHALLVDAEGYGVLALDDGAVPQERALVRFAPDGRPVVTARQGAATRQDAARARAARTVAAARLVPGRQDVIALPSPRRAAPDAPVEVYALALPETVGDVVLGIHWHATVAADGAALLSREPLSRSALVLPARGDTPPFAVEVTHFGAVPSEIHTWASLRHGIALSVVTLDSGMVWSVEGERTLPVGRVES